MFSSHHFSHLFRRALPLLIVVLLAACSSPEEKAQNYYQRGTEFLSKQDYTKAAIEFKNAVQLRKNFVEAWRGLLQVDQHNRDIQGSIPVLRTIVELDPKDIESRLQLGHYLMVGGALDDASNLANEAIALNPKNAHALAFKAAVLLKQKDNNGAKREAQRALENDPANAEALIVLAAESMGRGDNEGALAILDRPGSSYKREDEFAIQVFKLQIYEKLGDLKQEEALLRKLVDLYPFEPGLQKALIGLYVKEKRYDDAEKELRAYAAANPSDVAAGLNLVGFLRQFKGPAAAREELLARIKAGGAQEFKYQLALAEFDFAQGKVADSVQSLEKLISSAQSSENVLAAQVKLAQIQFQQKKYDASENLVTSILRKDNRNIDGLKLRAALRLQQGQLETAVNDLRQALDDQPRATDLMVLLAAAYERSGSIELADKEYSEATRISNFDVGVTLNYVTFLRRRGNLERAEDILTQLSRQWPNNTVVLAALADVRLARQNWTGAQEVAEAIRRIGDKGALADEVMAAALNGQGKFAESVKILEGVQSAAPTAVQPIAALVNTLIRAQKLDEAEKLLQNALKSNPDNAEAHVMLGSVLLLKNAPDQAEKSFRTAIEQKPKDAAGYVALANMYVREKKLDDAEKVIQSGLKQQSDSFPLRLAFASSLELKGDYDGAIAQYEILIKQDPGSLVVANNLASLLSDHRTDKASIDRAYSLAAVLRKSPNPSFKDTTGWIDYLRGDYKSATALLEEAAAAIPNRPVIQYHLGMSYAATGQTAKASEQFKKALALNPDPGLQEKISTAQKKAAL